MRNLVLHHVIRGSEPSAERRIRIAACGGCAGRRVRIGAGGSAWDIAIPFDVPIIREITYIVNGAVIKPAYHA